MTLMQPGALAPMDTASAALTLRDRLLPLPGAEQGYASVLLLGTTGAGKTTLVRQLLGTHPRLERFPPTSTAKTTVAEMELALLEGGPFRTIVTFAVEDELRQHLEENVLAAALALLQGKDQGEVLRRLLDHVDQRFRFSYVLGQPRKLLPELDDEDLDDDDEEGETAPDEAGAPESAQSLRYEQTGRVVRHCLLELQQVVEGAVLGCEDLRREEPDEAWSQDSIESNLDEVLLECGTTSSVVDALLAEIRRRFDAFDVGEVHWSNTGWPEYWCWSSEDRSEFIRVLSRFTSNNARAFGALLTPLVNGVRVLGPFQPAWTEDHPRLVLIDGEGLGHVPGSVAALSTFVARRLDHVDAVLLVDNAMQPMQAAPVAALKCIAVSGNVTKLSLLFTHFDQVKGDNLPTLSSREEHVLASVDNVLNAIGKELGPSGEHHLRKRLHGSAFFAGGLQSRIDAQKKVGSYTQEQLRRLVSTFAVTHPSADQGTAMSQPVFERLALTLAVLDATQAFHRRWRGLLGLERTPEAPKQHWARIKALTRRVAAGQAEYARLNPAGELSYALQSRIYRLLQDPVEWLGPEPNDVRRQEFLDTASSLLTGRLVALALERVVVEHQPQWLSAYQQRGPGSSRLRAALMEDDSRAGGAGFPPAVEGADQRSRPGRRCCGRRGRGGRRLRAPGLIEHRCRAAVGPRRAARHGGRLIRVAEGGVPGRLVAAEDFSHGHVLQGPQARAPADRAGHRRRTCPRPRRSATSGSRICTHDQPALRRGPGRQGLS